MLKGASYAASLAALLATSLVAESPPAGLKVLSIAIDPQTRGVTVEVQNVTDKTIVANAIVYWEKLSDGSNLNPEGAGIAMDYADPDNSGVKEFIRPGQIATIRGYSTSPEVVSVEATVAAVVYEDRTSEGKLAPMLFATRQRQAKAFREAAAKETDGERRAELERRAEWYETNGPKRAEK